MTTKKEKIEEIQQEINKLDEQIKEQQPKINDSPEMEGVYHALGLVYEKQGLKEDELRKVVNEASEKYMMEKRYRRRWKNRPEFEEIKSSVKRGIKNGLGVKFMNQIKDEDMVRIVEELIKKDLEKTNANEIEKEIEAIKKEAETLEIKRNEMRKPLDELYEKKTKLFLELRNQKNKKEEAKKVEVGKLDELLPNIIREVNKSMIIDSLNTE